MTSLERRRAMFRAGSAAAERLRGEWKGLYPCPICLTEYGEDAVVNDLTEEHVPPESLGGRSLPLTCKRCNSTAGSSIDAQMLTGHKVKMFGTPGTLGPIDATSSVGGVKQRGTLSDDGETVIFRDVFEQNHPDTPDAMKHALGQLADGRGVNGAFSLNVRLDERLARIGWLRVGYLVAFAQFGYTAITGPAFSALRQQIRHPEEEILPVGLLVTARDEPATEMIVVPESPEVLSEALLIMHGHYTVVVPRPDAPADFYETLASAFAEEPSFAFSGRFYEWPRRLVCSLDNAEV